jgi:hypothetical protein
VIANPQHLDVEGMTVQPIFILVPVVASISGLTIPDHDTGIIYNTSYANSLSTATDKIACDADVVLTHADVVLTHADVVSTAASAAAAAAAAVSATHYVGTWDASTNTPTLVSSAGVTGGYYLVSAAGTTSLNGHAVWAVGDLAIFNGTVWEQVLGSVTNGQIATLLSAATSKTTPIDADSWAIKDSASGELQRVTGTNLKSYLKTYLDTLYAAAPPYSAIAGFIPSSIAGTSTTASFTISAGQATASTYQAVITKTTTTSWAASNGNAINGTDAASSTLANSTTYHVYMCSGASGTGSFVSASLTPTFPTGYAVSSRRVFSLRTTAAGALIADTFVEVSGGAVRVFPLAQTLDISTAVQGVTRILYTLPVPTGVKMEVMGRSSSLFNGTNGSVIFQSPDETDVAPTAFSTSGWSTAPGSDFDQVAYVPFCFPNWRKLTNTSAQIAVRGNVAGITVYWVTIEYTDARRA